MAIVYIELFQEVFLENRNTTHKYTLSLQTLWNGIVVCSKTILLVKLIQHTASKSGRMHGQWGSQIELIAVATILQLPVFLFSQQEDGSRKWIRYEPKSIADVNLDFHPRLRHLREINIPKSFRMEICQSQNRSHFDRICSLDTHLVPEEPVPKQKDLFLYHIL